MDQFSDCSLNLHCMDYLFQMKPNRRTLFLSIFVSTSLHLSDKYARTNVNKIPTRCNSMQIFIYCKVTLYVSGVTAPIIRSTKNCNRSLRYSVL